MGETRNYLIFQHVLLLLVKILTIKIVIISTFLFDMIVICDCQLHKDVALIKKFQEIALFVALKRYK